MGREIAGERCQHVRLGQRSGFAASGDLLHGGGRNGARGDQAGAQQEADWDEPCHQRFKLAMFCSISSDAWIDLELTS